MIQVSITKQKDLIRKVVVQGHAGYADKGEDLVCAGVSSIMIGILNALDLLTNKSCLLKQNQDSISIQTIEDSRDSQIILQAAIIQLKTMQERYSQYIRIKQTEV